MPLTRLATLDGDDATSHLSRECSMFISAYISIAVIIEGAVNQREEDSLDVLRYLTSHKHNEGVWLHDFIRTMK